MNINEIKILFVLNDELKFIVNNFINNYDQVINMWDNSILSQTINFENNSLDKMLILYNRINNFNNIYNFYYSILHNNSII